MFAGYSGPHTPAFSAVCAKCFCRTLNLIAYFFLYSGLLAGPSLGQEDVDLVIEANVGLALENGVVINRAVRNQVVTPEEAKTLLFEQMRGLIQNELNLVLEVCKPDSKQQQELVDLAESEWRAKTNSSVLKRTQQHVYGAVDLDSLAERIMRDWLTKFLTPEQIAKYDEELADRMLYRKQALISKMLDVLGEKLRLSSVQMKQVEQTLSEKWRDRWFRSLEATFENTSLLPEIRPVWISSFLTDAQRAALVSRENQVSFSMYPSAEDAPSWPLSQRFQIGSVQSSASIELEPEIKKRNAIKGEKIDKQSVTTERQDDESLPK